MITKKSTPGKFAYIRHFQQIGINAEKFEKTLIHFKSDVFAAVAVVDAKTPYFFLGEGWAVHRLGQNTSDQITFNRRSNDCVLLSAFHSFLVEIEMNAGYINAKHS